MTPLGRGRRRLTTALAAACVVRTVSAWPASPTSRVIVVGAGFGGATCAKYLRRLSPSTEVLLIDRRREFMTGPFTNAVVAGLENPSHITRRVAHIGRGNDITILHDAVTSIDPVTLRVRTASGAQHEADRLVIAPGIDMRWGMIEGLTPGNSERMPHAWLGDGQVFTLRDRLRRVRDGATIVIGAPPNPYRCPPGPYERASLIAQALMASGRRRVKVLLADAKDDFSKSALFKLEWDILYPGMIEWVPRSAGGEVTRVDTATGEVWLRGGNRPLTTDLASIIPPQRAAELAIRADLVDESGWCPIDPDNFESRRHPRIHVIGDACAAAPIPKSAFAANSQAKLCASAIAASFAGEPPPQARLLNTCYSLVSATEAISVSGLYESAAGKLTVVSEGMSPLAADGTLRRLEAEQAHAWYDNITFDSFGAA